MRKWLLALLVSSIAVLALVHWGIQSSGGSKSVHAQSYFVTVDMTADGAVGNVQSTRQVPASPGGTAITVEWETGVYPSCGTAPCEMSTFALTETSPTTKMTDIAFGTCPGGYAARGTRWCLNENYYNGTDSAGAIVPVCAVTGYPNIGCNLVAPLTGTTSSGVILQAKFTACSTNAGHTGGSGTLAVEGGSTVDISDINANPFSPFTVTDGTIECTGLDTPVPTATPTITRTPTITPTPTITRTPGPTSTPGGRATITPTPTQTPTGVAATKTPAPGVTPPVVTPPPAPTATPFGGPGGVVVPPPTGSGPSEGGFSWTLMAWLLAGTAGAAAAGGGFYLRRRRGGREL